MCEGEREWKRERERKGQREKGEESVGVVCVGESKGTRHRLFAYMQVSFAHIFGLFCMYIGLFCMYTGILRSM